MDGYTKRSFNSVIALTLHDHEVSQGKQSYKQFLTSLIMTRFWGENRTHNLTCQLDTFYLWKEDFTLFFMGKFILEYLEEFKSTRKVLWKKCLFSTKIVFAYITQNQLDFVCQGFFLLLLFYKLILFLLKTLLNK